MGAAPFESSRTISRTPYGSLDAPNYPPRRLYITSHVTLAPSISPTMQSGCSLYKARTQAHCAPVTLR
jgi:hypothetical protein